MGSANMAILAAHKFLLQRLLSLLHCALMKLRRTLLLSLAAFTLVLATACGGGAAPTTPSNSPVAVVPSPVLTGMDCLVGTWTVSPPSTSYLGMTMTIAADGSETEDYSNSQPVVDSGDSLVTRGTRTLRMAVAGDKITFTPVATHVTVKGTFADGAVVPPATINYDASSSPKVRASGSYVSWMSPRTKGYTCSATKLQLVFSDGSMASSLTRP